MAINRYLRHVKIHPLWLLVIFIIALVLGVAIKNWLDFYVNTSEQIERQEIHQKGYNYISPLLECGNSHDLSKNDLKNELEDVIEKNVKNKNINYASVYFRDLNNGPWIGINEKENFTPASLLKVPLMIAYLKIAEHNPSILEDEIIVEEGDHTLSQNIIPLRSVEAGKAYKIRDLLEYMIIYSDNQAANTLITHIDINVLNKTYLDLGIKSPEESQSENFMSVRDYASFFRILYNGSYLNRDMSEQALRILTHSQFNQGLSAGVPTHVPVAHKFGERVMQEGKQLHDCGIIYKENMPYLLCVMTRGTDFNKMSSAIREISSLVYSEFK